METEQRRVHLQFRKLTADLKSLNMRLEETNEELPKTKGERDSAIENMKTEVEKVDEKLQQKEVVTIELESIHR